MSFLFDFSLPRLHSTRDPSSADGTDDEAGAFSFGHARKRKRLGATMTEDVTGDGPGTNEMPDRHSRTRGLENPSGTGRRREEGFQHHPIVSGERSSSPSFLAVSTVCLVSRATHFSKTTPVDVKTGA